MDLNGLQFSPSRPRGLNYFSTARARRPGARAILAKLVRGDNLHTYLPTHEIYRTLRRVVVTIGTFDDPIVRSYRIQISYEFCTFEAPKANEVLVTTAASK